MQKRDRAEIALSQFIDGNPAYAIDKSEPEWYEGTNLITFGSFHNQPVVFKYFDWQPRKVQEEKALRLYGPTALVPKLYPVEHESILVMERLQGSTLEAIKETLEIEQQQRVYHDLGWDLAHIVEVTPGNSPGGRCDLVPRPGFDYEFYCQSDISTLFDLVVEHSTQILAQQDVPHKVLLDASLTALRKHRSAILSHPTFIQMDDLNTANVIVHDSKITGFIDLEMTRYGNEVLLLAAVLFMLHEDECLAQRWAWVRQGYEERRGKPIDAEVLSLACIGAPFNQFYRFMIYWSTDQQGARGWPIRDIKSVVETLQAVKL